MKMFSVQYLRGLAALIVLIAHAISHPYPYRVEEFRRMGSAGVILFFIISGFIMVYISGQGSFRPLDFLKRRMIRVVPLYWLATLALAAITLLAPSVLRSASYDGGRLLMSLLFVPHHSPNGEIAPLLKLGWTLNYEMFFYICFAALAFLTARVRVIALTGLFVALVILGALLPMTNPAAVFYTQKDILAFCVGMWIGLATLDGRVLNDVRLPAGLIGAAGIAALAAGFVVNRGGPVTVPVYVLQVGGSAAVLVAMLAAERKVPHMRLPTLFGDASYSIYLVHMYLVAGTLVAMRRLSPDMPLAVIMIAGMLAGGIGGILVHRLVEKPMLRLLQRPRLKAAASAARRGGKPVDGVSPALMPDAPDMTGR